MRRIALVALPLLIAAPLIAQQMGKPGSKNAAAITGGTYTADPDHSLISWEVDHLGFSPYYGLFGDVAGTLTIDPTNLAAAKVDVTIPISKVTTASAGLTSHLLRPGKDGKKADFFGSAPADARFVSTKVMPRKDQTAIVEGNLTLNGITRPVSLEVEFYGAGKAPPQMGGKENVGFEAEGTIKRSEFGLGFGIPAVGDEIELDIAAAFQK